MKTNRSRVTFIEVCIVGIIATSAPVHATVYHVPGDYSTVQAGYEACSPGDTVVVADGVYTNAFQDDVLRLDKSGSPGAPITVEAENIGGAILDGQNLYGADGYGAAVYFVGNYNVVRGFKIQNGFYSGVSVYGSYNQVLQNEIFNNGNLDNGGSGNTGIHDNRLTSGNSYVGNYVHDNGRISLGANTDHGLYLEGTNNEAVINNLVIGNCTCGVQVAGYNGVANMVIYNNTIVSNRVGAGIILWMTVDGIDIANNILYGNAGHGVSTFDCHGSGVQIRNNLFYANQQGPWIMDNGGSDVLYTTSGNITNSDPAFVNAASDWHLQKCSDAIDSGLTLGPVTSDFDGLPRPIGAAYDIGVYER